MPQPKKAGRFGGTAAHHNLIMANLTTELIRHGRITTTYAKAKTVQPLAEKMITFARRGDVHSRRQVLRVIRDQDVVHKLFTDVGPAFAERDGGYTRVLKVGPRKGDAAPMALIELVEGVAPDGGTALTEAPRRRWSLRRGRGTRSAAARTREEERAAAAERGEEPAGEPEPPPPPQASTAAGEEQGLSVDPAEVEARLAAEEEAAERGATADEASEDEERGGEAPPERGSP